MPVKAKTPEELLDHLLSNAIDEGECLISHLKAGKRGYVYVDAYGSKQRAHRFVYEMEVGPLKKSDMVLHSCDRRNCINAEHLYVGDALQNTRDMMERRRGSNQYGAGYDFSPRESRLRSTRKLA